MDKVIHFYKNAEDEYLWCGQTYYDFIDYAFDKADYFMLVYVNYYGKGYSAQQKYFKEKLKKFKVKSRSNPSWPGTPATFCPDTTYKIVFYKTDSAAKPILKEVDRLNKWSNPTFPEDLAFFIGNKCWFWSVGHENLAEISRADEKDTEFINSKGLNSSSIITYVEECYFQDLDESLE